MDAVYLGNSLRAWSHAGAAFALVLAAAWTVKALVLRRLKAAAARSAARFDDSLIELADSVTLVELSIVALHVSLRSLNLPGAATKIVHILLVLTLARRGALMLRSLVDLGVSSVVDAIGARDPSSASALRNLKFFLHIGIWFGALLLVLDNLGVDITAAVAGLGITGLAVAMAAQTVLKDLFGSFVIFLDKPFQIGDFIVAGDVSGSVEHIGIKTTRLRSLSGEQIVVANADLTSARIRNYKRLKRRTVVRSFEIDRATPPHVLRDLPKRVKEMVSDIEGAAVGRVHLKGIGVGLVFELVYSVDSSDYGVHMDIQQDILVGLLSLFREHGVAWTNPLKQILEPAQ